MLIGVKVRTVFDFIDYESAVGGVTVDLSASGTNVTDDGDGGQDMVSGIEVVSGSNFADTITGGNTANDEYEEFRGNGGDDTIDGGSGFDRVRYQTAPSGVIVNLSNATETLSGSGILSGHADDGEGGDDTLISIESIVGSNHDDYLIGNSNSSTQFRPRRGSDVVVGGTDADEVDYAFPGFNGGVNVDLDTGGEAARHSISIIPAPILTTP